MTIPPEALPAPNVAAVFEKYSSASGRRGVGGPPVALPPEEAPGGRINGGVRGAEGA